MQQRVKIKLELKIETGFTTLHPSLCQPTWNGHNPWRVLHTLGRTHRSESVAALAVHALDRGHTSGSAAPVQRQATVVGVTVAGRVKGVALVHPIISRLGGLCGEAVLVH